MRCRFYWPDVARTVAECDKNSGRMLQDCCPDVTGLLSGCGKNTQTKDTVNNLVTLVYDLKQVIEEH